MRDGSRGGEFLPQPFVMVGVGDEGLDDVEEGREVMFVHVVRMSCVALHCPLVTKDIVPVVAIFTTGTEGGDIMLWNVNSESAGCSKMLLTQPAGGAVVIASILLYEGLGG